MIIETKGYVIRKFPRGFFARDPNLGVTPLGAIVALLLSNTTFLIVLVMVKNMILIRVGQK